MNAVVKKEAVATVQTALEAMRGQLANALPTHIKPERMIRVALTAVQNTPKLLECDRASFYLAVLRAAQLGLEPDGVLGQAYLIPYGGKVQLIPGYKGLIDLARRSGEVSSIVAKEVYENDEFFVDYSREVPFVHKPILEGERGEVKFFWAMARFKDGGFHWDYMTCSEVIAIRDGSSGWQTAVKYKKTSESPWEKHFNEMGKKTVIRRIAKFLPMSVQRAAIVEDLVDSGKKFSVDTFGEILVDPEDAKVVSEDMPATPAPSAAEAIKDKLKSRQENPAAKPAPVATPAPSAISQAIARVSECATPTDLEELYGECAEALSIATDDEAAQFSDAYNARMRELTGEVEAENE
jgi:recombination protein RecT